MDLSRHDRIAYYTSGSTIPKLTGGRRPPEGAGFFLSNLPPAAGVVVPPAEALAPPPEPSPPDHPRARPTERAAAQDEAEFTMPKQPAGCCTRSPRPPRAGKTTTRSSGAWQMVAPDRSSCASRANSGFGNRTHPASCVPSPSSGRCWVEGNSAAKSPPLPARDNREPGFLADSRGLCCGRSDRLLQGAEIGRNAPPSLALHQLDRALATRCRGLGRSCRYADATSGVGKPRAFKEIRERTVGSLLRTGSERTHDRRRMPSAAPAWRQDVLRVQCRSDAARRRTGRPYRLDDRQHGRGAAAGLLGMRERCLVRPLSA
jgi:hypothetical protein